jgi:hypothetical protein
MTSIPLRKSLIALALLVACVFLASPGVGAEPPDRRGGRGEGNDVRIVVYLIDASDNASGVDPEIKGIVNQLRGTFGYSSYRLVSKIRKNVPVGNSEKFSLPGPRELTVFAHGREGNRIKLKVKVHEKSGRGGSRDALNTEFRIADGGTIIIGGYKHDGGRLIVAISADM